MNQNKIDGLVSDWDDVYKKGQLALWMLIAIYDGKKYSAQIAAFMFTATNGAFEVKEQSLYRALRRFSSMGLVVITEEHSPSNGPKRKYFELTETGRLVLKKFIERHVIPFQGAKIQTLIHSISKEGA